MLKLTSIFLVFLVLTQVFAEVQKSKNGELECAVCQFMGTRGAQGVGGQKSGDAIAHCKMFEGCERQLEECEIAKVLLDEITSDEKAAAKFQKSKPFLETAVAKCAINPKALVISEDPSSTTCMMCFLVYDVLKYINFNILDNPMLGEVKTAIETACAFLSAPLCEALFEPDAFSAIIRGLKDSLGGFYDLIAVQGFNCPNINDLFGQC